MFFDTKKKNALILGNRCRQGHGSERKGGGDTKTEGWYLYHNWTKIEKLFLCHDLFF